MVTLDLFHMYIGIGFSVMCGFHSMLHGLWFQFPMIRTDLFLSCGSDGKIGSSFHMYSDNGFRLDWISFQVYTDNGFGSDGRLNFHSIFYVGNGFSSGW